MAGCPAKIDFSLSRNQGVVLLSLLFRFLPYLSLLLLMVEWVLFNGQLCFTLWERQNSISWEWTGILGSKIEISKQKPAEVPKSFKTFYLEDIASFVILLQNTCHSECSQ
uniref:Uncharacterized protein n=2 Tax=Micrurus TaxID=8634 RepID=A0A2D4IHA0_MICLE